MKATQYNPPKDTRVIDFRGNISSTISAHSSGPDHIPVSNAASEFLCGRHVIYAALAAKRRHFFKLYRLTEHMRNTKKTPEQVSDDPIQRLAHDARVPVINVNENWKTAFRNACQTQKHDVSKYLGTAHHLMRNFER